MSRQPSELFSLDQWMAIRKQHLVKVREYTQTARKRADRGEKHPIQDFLTQYYRFSLGSLESWHPGFKVRLEFANQEYFPQPLYNYYEDQSCEVNPLSLKEKERERFSFIASLLEQTQNRSPLYSCFGMHEWAMVYQGNGGRHRESAPLRLPQAKIDAFVRSRPLVCTHFDAFRFFSPNAKPLNLKELDLHSREQNEQPGCLHANMDLYKWSMKLGHWVGSQIQWECFQLALQARELDMRASPYDLRKWGYDPIFIETDKGRAQYLTKQKEIEYVGNKLRLELSEQIRVLLSV